MDCANAPEFNPFIDRLSRDLRNELSEGLASWVETGSEEKLNQIIDGYETSLPSQSCYTEYLEDRVKRFRKALSIINENGYSDPVKKAAVLWNHQLFFEMHEVLEHIWYDAAEEKKRILQALIRAAGVYIKLEYNFNEAAARIAEKALPVLQQHRSELQTVFAVDTLIEALSPPLGSPPQLAIAG